MKTLTVLVLAVAALLPVARAAADPAATPTPSKWFVLGPGRMGCDDWASKRRAHGVDEFMLETWVMGFVSGYNAFVAPNGDVTSGLPPNDIFDRVDRYCEANPHNDVSDGAEAMVREIRGRKH
jgi:hypothetical protein